MDATVEGRTLCDEARELLRRPLVVECRARLESALASEPAVADTFMSDIHGDAAAFDHLVRTASGATRTLVERACGDLLGGRGCAVFSTLLAYPELARETGLELGEGFDELARLVRRHGTGSFHMAGDVWDRGARGDDVMDVLMELDDADVQWGNHDVCWMGAAAGDPVCIATCVRNNMKYGNTEQFEEGYGICLDPLRELARDLYVADDGMDQVMKAASALLFKLEGQAVLRHPEWHMDDRLLWGTMDAERGVVDVYGTACELTSTDFPTRDAADPWALSERERTVVDGLVAAFTASERLQAQIQWLYDRGGVYRVCGDGSLLVLHGCVPLTDDGALAPVTCDDGVERAGKALLDHVDLLCRRAWEGRAQSDLDWMGYLWCGWQSTFAGRVVKTFERTYIADKETWKEPEDPYYALTREDAGACGRVLADFGCDPATASLVNGHTPVKLPKGEKPVRAGGRRLVIDGGLCQAYRKTTGIAGYTLVRRSSGELALVAHGEFPGEASVFEHGADVEHEVQHLE